MTDPKGTWSDGGKVWEGRPAAVGGEAMVRARSIVESHIFVYGYVPNPDMLKDAIAAALAQPASPLRGRDYDQIALDAAHQIEALPTDLHEAQKTARIQLIVLHALHASPPEQPAAQSSQMLLDALDAKNARIAELEEALGKAVLAEPELPKARPMGWS